MAKGVFVVLLSLHAVYIETIMATRIFSTIDRETKSDRDARCDTIYLPRCKVVDIYRTFDGRCNNVEHPAWGSSGTVLRRLLPPDYDDGSGLPRRKGARRNLPLPRKVSNELKESNVPVSTSVSQMHVLYGQLLAHDIVHTPVIKDSMGNGIKCKCGGTSDDCINVELPANDPMRFGRGETCIPLVRSKPAVSRTDCTFQTREQTTTMSSYMDATFLYGKSDQEADDLRDPSSKSGELLLVRSPYGGSHKHLPKQKDLMHKSIASTMDCNADVRRPANGTCFVSGDVRVGENIGLSAIQTAFARYHNWVARGLKGQNPLWNSDKVFLEARRIISAIFQSITYREYLPQLVGPVHMKRFGLTLTNSGYWNGYDSRYDASITNEFTTAAFRYGHSQVSGTIYRPTSRYNLNRISPVLTKDSFFNTEAFAKKADGGSGSILRGFMTDSGQRTDTNFVDALRDQLFVHRGKSFGGDLFAINIQRGRDHGLSSYNSYREFCGLKRARSFTDLAHEISFSKRRQLQLLYDDVNDIDLYVGGLAENHVGGGVVGPTFACILSHTMRALRRGDRLWHEVQDSNHPFTLPQLESIRKVGLASILCQTGEDMKYVITSPLLKQRGKRGYVTNCGNVAKLNFKLWGGPKVTPTDPFLSPTSNEWTAWFVTNNKIANRVNVRSEFARVKSVRPNDVCDDFISWRLRFVRHDAFVQISFSCKVGTIAATDFPFEASDGHKWTKWIQKQSVSAHEFQCKEIVAIQAKTLDDGAFALETGDVLEKFGPDGFSCKDQHQENGKCHRFKVRALCFRDTDNYPPTSVSPPDMTRKVPDYIRRHTKLLCNYFNLCCEISGSITYSTQFVPSHVRQAAKAYCRSYNVCCDA